MMPIILQNTTHHLIIDDLESNVPMAAYKSLAGENIWDDQFMPHVRNYRRQ